MSPERTWFVFLSTTNWNDYKIANRMLRQVHRRLQADYHSGGAGPLTLWILWFGPKKSSVPLMKMTAGGIQVEGIWRYSDYDDIVSITRSAVASVVSNRAGVPIDGLYAYYHAAGFVCGGQWKRKKHHFMRVVDFCNEIVMPLRPPLVVFDACYMGNMTCLYEMPPFVHYVVASPGFHPYVPIMKSEAFFSLPQLGVMPLGMQKEATRQLASALAVQWMSLAWPRARYSCLLVFDSSQVAPLAHAIRDYWPLLKFGEHSRIDKEDANLSDLYNASSCAPMIRNLIEKVYLPLPYSGRCPRVNGPSLERRLPKKWQREYMATKLYRDILSVHWGL